MIGVRVRPCRRVGVGIARGGHVFDGIDARRLGPTGLVEEIRPDDVDKALNARLVGDLRHL